MGCCYEKSMRDEVEIPLWKKIFQTLKKICLQLFLSIFIVHLSLEDPDPSARGGEISQSILTTLYMASNKVHRVVFLYVPVLDN